eukprot:4553927-Pyramimonas_sp.AAC.1
MCRYFGQWQGHQITCLFTAWLENLIRVFANEFLNFHELVDSGAARGAFDNMRIGMRHIGIVDKDFLCAWLTANDPTNNVFAQDAYFNGRLQERLSDNIAQVTAAAGRMET